jgi:hypothetical protein
MMKEPAHDARAEAIEPAIAERLTAFDRHRDDLLAILQKVCDREPKTKSFDPDKSWRYLRLKAWGYLEREPRAEQRQKMVPAARRVELLHELGKALREARCKLDEARHSDIRGRLFVEWCEAHGNPDLLEFLDLVGRRFDEVVAGVITGLADLETAASRAAEQVRQKPGRPRETGYLSPKFIIALESAYRYITGKRGGAGAGPFAQFVKKFLEAQKSTITLQSVIEAIKTAKKRKEWGRPLFVWPGKKTPPSSLP